MVMVVNKAYGVLEMVLLGRYSSCERSLEDEWSGCEVIAKATGE